MSRIYKDITQLDFTPSGLPKMELPGNVLMVKPTFFDVEYVINPHMEGQIGGVDKIQAQNEWEFLLDGYRELGMNVSVLEGKKGLPDLVFCANQSLPFLDEAGNRKAIMSKMYAPQRQPEVPVIEKWYHARGYETIYLDLKKNESFEGTGDAIWHPGKRLLWGAYGFRTSVGIYEQLSSILDVPVIALELQDEHFYHLDTCMCMLNETTVLIYADAFTKQGLELIHSVYDTVIEASRYEAEKLFAVNAACPDGRNVLIQQGCTDVNKKLRDAGFSVHEYSTYEFLKSGGSVFCMKLLYW